MKTINLSEIKNHQNEICYGDELAVCERILLDLLINKKGRRRKSYINVNGKTHLINIDLTKDDVEEVYYCDFCGFQTTNENERCPKHPNHEMFIGTRVKGTQHNLYSDSLWNKIKEETKKTYIYLDRFKKY